MLLGKICGKASTTQFIFSVVSSKTKKFQFIQIYHRDYGPVLGQIVELERTAEEMLAKCNVIGYKDTDGRIKGIRTPFEIGLEVLEAEDSFVKKVVELEGKGGFLGNLEGKNIPISVDLQKILTKHLAVLAKSGAGKSYCVGVLLEEVLEKKVPLLIIDPHGEYNAMRTPALENKEKLKAFGLEPKGYGAHLQEYGDTNLRNDVRPLKLKEQMSKYELMKLLPLTLTSTQEALLFSVLKDLEEVTFDNILLGLEQFNSTAKWTIIDTIMYLRSLHLFSAHPTPFEELIVPGKCSIINLKGITPEVQDVIVYKLLKDLFLARKQEKIPPFFCVIEEAHNFCPEKGFGKAKSLEVIRLISSEGRKFGLGLCVVSQRPALVQKSILAQCSTQIIMKVTNPNDLRAIGGSIEGMSQGMEEEIQNLPIGTALVCGIVDRPLVVEIRPRKSSHGGHAIDMLKKEESDGYHKDVVEEAEQFEEKGMLPLILPKVSIKEIKLMATAPIKKITTYLIPACFVSCELRGVRMNVLIDKVKGMLIVDPESDAKYDVSKINLQSQFFRKPVYDTIPFDIKIEEQLSLDGIKKMVERYATVIDGQDCFIVYNKVEF